MAVFMVGFSYGLAAPFMELSVGKRCGQPREYLWQAEGLDNKHERNNERSERKQREDAERLEDKQRARKRALLKGRVA